MEDKRYIKKRYIFINIIMIGLAVLLFVLPEKYSSNELKPETLLKEINDNTRFVSTDYIADKLIKNDRHTVLIDVRSKEEFNDFHLPGAINIPLNNILDKNEEGKLIWESILNQVLNKNIFYSNGTVYANQAWMITRRLNFSNNYVMKGGLNNWIETIIQPKKPNDFESDSEFARYDLRKAASMFFGKGGNTNLSSEETEEEEETIPVIINDSKPEEEGGC